MRRETTAIVDDLAFRQNIDSDEEEVNSIIKRIQQFDPPGVAARDLQECLLLQLNRQKEEGKPVDTAIAALTKYFDEFTKKHYEKIQRGLGLTDDQLKEVMQQIIRLNRMQAQSPFEQGDRHEIGFERGCRNVQGGDLLLEVFQVDQFGLQG